jgi:hypothetical protein
VKIAGRILVGLAVAAAALVNGAFLLLIGSLRCDENCTLGSGEGTKPGVPWGDTADAWQWAVIQWLGVACFVLAVAGAVLLHVRPVRRRGVPVALLILALIAGAIPWIALTA